MKHRMWCWILVAFFGGLAPLLGQLAPQSDAAKTENPAEYDAGPLPSAGLENTQFRWWAPANVKVRGVLVLLPGRGGDGRGMANDPAWQALATKTQFGLMGCLLKNKPEEPFTYQGDPNGVVSDLLNKAVNTMLAQNQQQLRNPPLAFWGHSAGANVSELYAARHPDRVVATVLVRGTRGPGNLAPGKESVPVLILVGKKDKPEWVSSALGNYEKGRAANALWSLALNPNEGHEIGKTPALALAYLEAAIGLRLPAPGSGFATPQAVKPKHLARTTGWLGDTNTLEVTNYNQFRGKKQDATWLPDEPTAKAWQDYLHGN